MFDKLLVKYCAPTLMRIKTASMFTYKCSSYKHLSFQISYWNSVLNPKGIYLTLFKYNGDRAIMYLYIKNKLENLFTEQNVSDFLENYGYNPSDLDACLNLLSSRFTSEDNLPHEVGVFLGYPLNDVKSFIKHSGKNSLHTGYWKVYHDKEQSIKMFNIFDRCRVIYNNKFLKYKRLPI